MGVIIGDQKTMFGSGSGFGFGSGSGYGSGSGDGDGYGSGYGSGSGSGDGSGYGYGDGDELHTYWRAATDAYAANLPSDGRSRLVDLVGNGAVIGFWKSDSNGRPCNGGNGQPAKPGDVHEVDGPLELCSRRALHATMLPNKWKGDRLWLVALVGDVRYDDDKMGALRREIIGECVGPQRPAK